jgi:hypothetical protein
MRASYQTNTAVLGIRSRRRTNVLHTRAGLVDRVLWSSLNTCAAAARVNPQPEVDHTSIIPALHQQHCWYGNAQERSLNIFR